ncbi:hypothetical protein EHF33_07920 [Deinococcus psychrotolerans]|uniref:Lipoprotein n=1 Tax=Deinococcus psychrotolerans TaxID=2489213 RepID=A0A3G8YCG0_9DEIO|nr:hypothetical protein [Deinococcus psychrotolerans]AZI42685.1 hypothetical protein EHF33_07920 [Deinococcus psychrotolerans]
MIKKLAFALLVTLAATSCNRETGFKPMPISFKDHPSILRGTWNGNTTANQVLSLNLTATYDTSRQYQVTGTGSLGSESLTVAGSVSGGSVHSYLKAQLSPAPEFADLTLKRSGMADLNLRCSGVSGNDVPARLSCRLPDTSTSFQLTKGNP